MRNSLTLVVALVATTILWAQSSSTTAEADFQLGLRYFKEGNQTEAVKYFRLAAQQGYADAQYVLGACYYDGNGVTQDYTEAVKYYRLAAQLGHASAQYNLGVCYEKGNGVTQDDTEAVRYYRLAAQQGDALAQYNLGNCYYNGNGVTQNYTEAVKYYRLAAQLGYAKAQYNLGTCYAKGNGVTQDYTEAVKYYRLAAQQGQASAQYNLGVCYAEGTGVTQDYTEAVKYYRLAAQQGHASAQYKLGVCYAEGTGVTQDDTEAVKYYRLAAQQGDADAQCMLGFCYAEGTGVTQDYEEAKKWYEKAAAQGNGAAKIFLSILPATVQVQNNEITLLIEKIVTQNGIPFYVQAINSEGKLDSFDKIELEAPADNKGNYETFTVNSIANRELYVLSLNGVKEGPVNILQVKATSKSDNKAYSLIDPTLTRYINALIEHPYNNSNIQKTSRTDNILISPLGNFHIPEDEKDYRNIPTTKNISKESFGELIPSLTKKVTGSHGSYTVRTYENEKHYNGINITIQKDGEDEFSVNHIDKLDIDIVGLDGRIATGIVTAIFLGGCESFFSAITDDILGDELIKLQEQLKIEEPYISYKDDFYLKP